MGTERTHITVFLFLLMFYTVTSLLQYQPYHFLRGDSSFYAQIDRSLAKDFTLRQEKVQPRSWYTKNMGWNTNFPDSWSDISLGRNGEWYPKHPFLMSIVALPFFLVFGIPGLLIFSILIASIGMYFAYRSAQHLFDERSALIALAVFIPFRIMIYNTYGFRNDIFFATLVSASLFYALTKKSAVSGLLAGFALFAKITNILILLPVLTPILLIHGRRHLLRFFAAVSVPVFLLALANTLMYGAPWVFSYQRVLVMHNGHPQMVTHTSDFRFPFWQGLRRLIMDRGQGLLNIAPATILGLLGLPFLFRKAKWLTVGFVIAFVAFFLFHAKYIYLWGRFFLPWYEIAMIPAAGLVSGIDIGLKRLEPMGKRIVWGGVFGLLLLTALGRWVWLSTRPADMYNDVEALTVSLDNIPCDYFNMGDEKWECSHFDRGNRYFTGRALGAQCDFKEKGNRFIVIPSDHIHKRIVTWTPAHTLTGKVSILYGRERGSGNKPIKLSVFADNRPFVTLDMGNSGVLKQAKLVLPGGIHSLTVTVPASSRRIRACVNIVPGPRP